MADGGHLMVSDPHSFSDPAQGRIAHVHLRLRPDFSSHTVRFQADYSLDRPVTGSLFLDCRGQTLASVRSDGADVPWASDRQDPILGQRLHLQDLRGARQISIEGTTSPSASCLQWLEPQQTAGGRHPFLYSQGQSIQTRSLLPCQDTPSVRFTYEAEIEAPHPLSAVMGAAADGVTKAKDADVFRFAMPQPIPSYLLAFAVGNLSFEAVGARTGIYAEPEILQEAAWEFAENEDRLRAGESLFGPYLWDRYDVLIMPPAFPYGGMENPRLTFLNSTYVEGDRSGGFMIAHELAHAWTGNLVTNATWEDFWLNEGPTVYAETRISEVIEGVETAQLRTAGRARRLQREIERMGPTSPMTCLRLDLVGKDPEEGYTDIPYFKGLLFFRSLEQAAGRTRFDVFLKDYIAAFRFHSLTADEFLSFLEQHLPEAARAVDARRWIYKPGLPEGAADAPSSLLEDVMRVREAYLQGERPTAERVAAWSHLQQSVFLGALLPRIPTADCAYFADVFGLGRTRDGELFTRFCELAVRSGYRDILPAYETFFGAVGRFSFHQPVFRALVEESWSRPLARPLLERARPHHHPSTVTAIERILAQAGL
jgi:aminopeptidase N